MRRSKFLCWPYADNIELRMKAHYAKDYANCYTAARLPVQLVFIREFETRDEAFIFERQIKGWSRKKKEALINGDIEALKAYSKKVWK